MLAIWNLSTKNHHHCTVSTRFFIVPSNNNTTRSRASTSFTSALHTSRIPKSRSLSTSTTTTTLLLRNSIVKRHSISSRIRQPLKQQQQQQQLISKQQQHQQQNRRFKSTTNAAASDESVTEIVQEPGFNALKMVALTQAIPFIGFGFMDNAILIVAGDAIDTSLGVLFGISTLCAAAIGNIVSDLAGIGLGTVIEDFCAQTLKLPIPDLTAAQRQLRSVRFANQLGMAAGMTLGCIIGMFPLFFIDSDKITRLKQKAKMEALFRDVVTEAKSLVGAESTLLYLRVDKEKTKDKTSALPYKPNVEGESLYAMFYDVPKNTREEASRVLPLGKGIVSRALLTGMPWKIDDVHAEPDFYPVSAEQAKYMKHMLVVPVLDGQGRAIAAIRAMNKVGNSKIAGRTNTKNSTTSTTPGPGFTDQDVLILKSLASHISVALQSIYQEDEDAGARLQDTIRILKDHGIQGLQADNSRKSRALFPEN